LLWIADSLRAGNGRCVIDVEIEPGAKEDSITEFGIHVAAYNLIRTCVGPQGFGGRISNLGTSTSHLVTVFHITPVVVLTQQETNSFKG